MQNLQGEQDNRLNANQLDPALVLEFTRYGTGYGVKKKLGVTITGKLAIPDSYKGNPVTSIAHNTFQGCSGLTSITLPASLTSLGDYAFANTGLQA